MLHDIYDLLHTTYNVSEYVVTEAGSVVFENLPDQIRNAHKNIPNSEDVLKNVTEQSNKFAEHVQPQMQQAMEITSDAVFQSINTARPHAEKLFNTAKKSYDDLSAIPEVQMAKDTLYTSSKKVVEEVSKAIPKDVHQNVKSTSNKYYKIAMDYFTKAKTETLKFVEKATNIVQPTWKAMYEQGTHIVKFCPTTKNMEEVVGSLKNAMNTGFTMAKEKFEELEKVALNEANRKSLKARIEAFEKRYPATAGKISHGTFIELCLTLFLVLVVLFFVGKPVAKAALKIIQFGLFTIVLAITLAFNIVYFIVITFILNFVILGGLKLAVKTACFVICFPFSVLRIVLCVMTCGLCCRRRRNNVQEIVDEQKVLKVEQVEKNQAIKKVDEATDKVKKIVKTVEKSTKKKK